MAVPEIQQTADQARVFNSIVEILTDILVDWDIHPISAETYLKDCVYESISLVYLIGDLQHTYHLQDQLGKQLRASQTNITELRVAELVEMVCHLIESSNSDEEGPA